MYKVQIPGNVPQYEEHEARLGAGYMIPEWYELEPGIRAIEVALYRIKKAVNLAGNDAVDAKMQRARKHK